MCTSLTTPITANSFAPFGPEKATQNDHFWGFLDGQNVSCSETINGVFPELILCLCT
jgi:hypothetical protein